MKTCGLFVAVLIFLLVIYAFPLVLFLPLTLVSFYYVYLLYRQRPVTRSLEELRAGKIADARLLLQKDVLRRGVYLYDNERGPSFTPPCVMCWPSGWNVKMEKTQEWFIGKYNIHQYCRIAFLLPFLQERFFLLCKTSLLTADVARFISFLLYQCCYQVVPIRSCSTYDKIELDTGAKIIKT
jgi:hypothetical protein